MKKSFRLASAFLILILMNSCGNKVGRYQMVVSPPVEGETKYYDPAVIVCDTKTGKVWSHFVSGKSQMMWNPVDESVSISTLKIKKADDKP